MSSKIGIQNAQQVRDTFDLALIYNADLPKIKEKITNDVLGSVQNHVKQWEDWSNSRIARKLVENAFNKFQEVVKEKYSRPDFDYFLDCSIKSQYSYFYNELLSLVEKALQASHRENPEDE